MLAAKILAAVVVFDRSALDAFDLPKAMTSHALTWILLALVVGYGAREGPRVLLPRGAIAFSAIAVIGTYGLSSVFAVNPYNALYGEYQRYLGMVTIADSIVTLLAIVVAVREVRDLVPLVAAVGIGAAASLGYATIQALGRDPLQWAGSSATRPFAFFGNPDMFGQYLSSLFALGLGLSLFPPADAHPRAWRAAGAIGAVFALSAIVLVATRAALVGSVAAAVVSGLLVLVRGPARTRRTLGLVAAAGAIVAVLAGVMVTTPLGERVVNTLTTGAGIKERALIYESGIRMFIDHPIVGVGPDNFGAVYSLYRQREAVVLISRFLTESSAHNFSVQALATVGLVGFASIAALVATTAWRGLRLHLARSNRVAPIALTVGGAFLANAQLTVDSVSVMWILWVCLGVIAAPGLETRQPGLETPPEDRPKRSWPRLPLPLAVLLVLVALAVAPSSWQPVRASELSRDAGVLIQRGQAARAVVASKLAVSTDPGRAVNWNTLGQAQEQVGDFKESEAAFFEATARAPYRSEYWGNLARARANLAVRGSGAQKGPALEAARRGTEVDPNDPTAYHLLAELALVLDEPAMAVEAEQRAIEIFPADHTYYLQLAKAELGLRRFAAAEVTARRGMDFENVPALHFVRAQALVGLGRTAEARDELTYVLEREPANADARALLASLPR